MHYAMSWNSNTAYTFSPNTSLHPMGIWDTLRTQKEKKGGDSQKKGRYSFLKGMLPTTLLAY